MPPESLNNQVIEELDYSKDIYAAGILFLQLLTDKYDIKSEDIEKFID